MHLQQTTLVYMAESELMREARNRGSRFEGTVAAWEEYVGPLSPDISPKDFASWTGLTQKHVWRIASILSSEWISNMLFGRAWAMLESPKRTVPTISHIQLTCEELVETNHPQSESTTEGDQQDHQPATYTWRESFNVESEQNSPVPVGNENSSQLAVNERVELDVFGIHQNHPQLAADISHHRNSADSLAESEVTLTSSSGQRYRIHGFRSTAWLDPGLLFGRGKPKEILPKNSEHASDPSSAFDRFQRLMVEVLNVYYNLFFQSLDPIRLRLVTSVEQVKKTRTGTESWSTLIVMLYRILSGNRSKASPENSTEHEN